MPARRLASLLLTAAAAIAVSLQGAPAPAAEASSAVHDVNPKGYRVYHQQPGYVRYEFSSPSGDVRCEVAQYEDSAP